MKISYVDTVTAKILFFSAVSIVAIPYYFIAGGTLLGFIFVRLIAMFFGICSQIAWHRWLTHNSFVPSPLGRFLMFFGMLTTGIGKPLHLVVSHIYHHKNPDTETDPHSPKYIGYGKLWLGRYKKLDSGLVVPKSFFRDKQIVFFNKYYWWMFWSIIFVFCMIDLKTALIFTPVTVIYNWSLVNMVNYFGHKDGNNIGPRNVENKIFLFLTGGEALHKNHHEQPGNFNLGFNGEFDLGAIIISKILIRHNS